MKPDKPRSAEAENELYAAILQLKTLEECRAFFLDLCTPAELEAFVDRWRVAKMLTGDMSYRAIAEKTGVSVTTVTRVARFLRDGNDGYKAIIERMEGGKI